MNLNKMWVRAKAALKNSAASSSLSKSGILPVTSEPDSYKNPEGGVVDVAELIMRERHHDARNRHYEADYLCQSSEHHRILAALDLATCVSMPTLSPLR